jgi:N6-L-threonylcarbamoyladenine synthase
MKILAIETSCDETGISIIDASGIAEDGALAFTLLAYELYSQASLHSEYGGVYPTLAKREHTKALPILLTKALKEAGIQPSELDALAVTHGPGLEPALWTGINFAQDLATQWNLPLVPVNHMEGHIFSALLEKQEDGGYTITKLPFPTVALLISGGHTELVLIKEDFDYEYLGGTVDDAVGEAFDKASRMLGLGYPGGPIISKLAQEARDSGIRESLAGRPLPRPMIHSGDFNFSFSGLKTALLYKIKEITKDTHTDNVSETKPLPLTTQQQLSREFEDACAEVLSKKTATAMEHYGAQALIIGGGVAANSYINESIAQSISQALKQRVPIYTPARALTGDNALMIAVAGYLRAQRGEYADDLTAVTAHGTLKLHK